MKYFNYAIYLAVALTNISTFAGPKEDFLRAAEIDAVQVIKGSLETGFDPNVRNERGDVALLIALRAEAGQVARVLIGHARVDVDAANAHGETPLMMAALRGDLDSTKALLARGARLNREGWTPLHYAASGSSVELVEFLLDRGAEIEARSPNGTTPLMMAARYGAIDAADLLLRRGASARAQNQREFNAADFARGAGRDALAERLTPR